MADDTTTTDTTATGAPEAPKTFSAEYVADLRNEAARYRTERNTVAEQTRTAVTAEFQAKLDAALAENTRLADAVGESWILAEKIQASIGAGVPSDKLLQFANVLTGVDAASIKDSAENAKALFGITGSAQSTPTKATDPTQGAGSGQPVHALNSDGLLQAITKMVGA